MSQTSLLKLSSHRAAGKPERLLRAAVTAFCAIARPTRREIAQLDDLATPLLGCVSDDALRFTAAALSETPYAPPHLVRRICELPPAICAPLLMRSEVLTPIDLVALIGRHGTAHARAIAARPGLDKRIVKLIASIGAFEQNHVPDKVEETRDRLMGMMLPASETTAAPEDKNVSLRWDGTPAPYRKLRSTALAGAPALFHTALADALGIDLGRARAIADDTDVSGLIVALRSLALAEEEAFLIYQCVWPLRPADIRGVRAFLEAYNSVSQEQAVEIAASWRAPRALPEIANASGALRSSTR